jgi:hypothetical protein
VNQKSYSENSGFFEKQQQEISGNGPIHMKGMIVDATAVWVKNWICP